MEKLFYSFDDLKKKKIIIAAKGKINQGIPLKLIL